MDEQDELLSVSPFFRDLPTKAKTDILAAARQVEFFKGEVLFSPRQFPSVLGLVLEGRLEVTRGEMRMDVIGPGELFGAVSLFLHRDRYPTTITAKMPGRALFLKEDDVNTLLERHPSFARRYVWYLTNRVAFLSSRLDALGAGAAADKLLCYLRDAGGTVEDLPGTKLASALNLSRASLYRAMDALEQRNLITRAGKTIHLVSFNE